MSEFKQLVQETGLPTEEQQIKQQFESLTQQENIITNTSKMSPFWRLITAIAITPVKWLVDTLINDIVPNLFVKTAKGKWLQIHAYAVGLDFKPATKAKGVIHFTKESDLTDITVKQGTIIQTERINDVIYRLIVSEDTLIPKGTLTAPVAVEAEYAGTNYNLASGYYRILAERISGIRTVENKEDWLIEPGADQETDEELRERYRTQFSSVGQHHIDSVYKGQIAQVAGLSVDRIYFKHEAPRGPGTANAYLLLDTGVTSQPFIDKVNRHVQTEGYHGLGDDLMCFAMPETKHRLTCKVYFNTNLTNTVKAEILAEVENMIRSAFRENNNYQVTKTYPFKLFSWSKLGEEIHQQYAEIQSIVWGQGDIKSELSIPRIESLVVEVGQ